MTPLNIQSKRNDILWMSLGVIAVIALLYFFLAPELKAWQQAKIAVEAKNRDLAHLNAQVEAINAMIEALSTKDEALQKLDIAIPSDNSIETLIANLEAIAQVSNLNIEAISPVRGTNNQASVSLHLTGTYRGQEQFLKEINKNLRPLNITAIKTSAGSATGKEAVLTMVVTLHAAGLTSGGAK